MRPSNTFLNTIDDFESMTDKQALGLLQHHCMAAGHLEAKRGTLLDYLSRQGKVRCVEFLLENKMTFISRPQIIYDPSGRRTYYDRIFNHRYERFSSIACAEMLLCHLPTKFTVFDAIKGNDLALLYRLTTRKIDINGQDFLGNSPLHLAVKLRLKEAATLLLTYGARCSLSNAKGQTAIDIAVLNQDLDMVNLLLEHCAEVTPQALHVAASHGYDEICKRLLHFNPTAVIKVLNCAAKHGQIKCLRVLLMHFNVEIKKANQIISHART